MQNANRWVLVLAMMTTLGSGSTLSCAAVETADSASADIVNGAWQHHKVTFSYFGFTTLYTCDGLEEEVRQILLHVGARKDAKVTASGCPGPVGVPTHSAWVAADFYTLAPVAAANNGADTVKARWTSLEVRPRRPSFLGEGSCELIQEMKDLITQNFSLRHVDYRTSCFPHELTLDGFAVKGEALRALPLKSTTRQG
jgi:hypothetical protein